MYDLVIIGAAAAGSASAIYAARRNLHFTILTKDIGGEVALSGDIENWPSVIHTTGIELAQQFHKHIQSYNVPIQNGSVVTDITPADGYHRITLKDADGNQQTIDTKTIIIGSGIHPRNLNVLGEEQLRGKGVTYCTVCDGPLYKGKTTATIGAGNAALESALMMGGIAKKVYVLTKFANTKETKGGFPKGENILIDKVKALPNVEILYEANTTDILGEQKVSGIKYTHLPTNEQKEIVLDGAMIHVGMIPNSSFINCVNKNAVGEIEVDTLCRTTVPGIFAAGDVTNIPYKQIAIAVGQGVVAALSAIDYLNKMK